MLFLFHFTDYYRPAAVLVFKAHVKVSLPGKDFVHPSPISTQALIMGSSEKTTLFDWGSFSQRAA